VVPDGALIFFPSYKLLDKLCSRWKSTGRWERLSNVKELFVGNEWLPFLFLCTI
jgi:Fanconi anemia group J protein